MNDKKQAVFGTACQEKEAEEMKKCGKCEKMILDGAVKCPYCGATQEKKEENVQVEKTDIPEETEQAEKADMPEATMKKETETKEQKPSENGAAEQKQRATLNYCSNCGAKLEKDSYYCARCGKKVRAEGRMAKELFHDTEKTTGEIFGGLKKGIHQSEISASTVFCTAAIIFYLCSILRYTSGYQYYGHQILNFCMIAACAWNVFILYKTGFQCFEQNGANLMYGLLAGCGAEILLFIIRQSQSYYGVSGVEYAEFLRPFIVAGAVYYLIKKEGYLADFSLHGMLQALKTKANQLYSGMAAEKTEKKKEAFSGQENEEGKKEETKRKEAVFEEGKKEETERKEAVFEQGQGKIWQLITGKIFIIFCIVFTGELLYQLFSNLSFLYWIGKTLTIFLCVFLWQIFLDGRKNRLHPSAFSNVALVIKIEYIIKLISGIVACIFGIISGPIGFIATIVMTIVDVCYAGALRKMAKSVQGAAEGTGEEIKITWYPILVTGVNTLMKGFAFFKTLATMSAMNYTYGIMNSYENTAGFWIMSFLQDFGADTDYGIISYLINFIFAPFRNLIRGIFGGYANPWILLLELSVLVCEFLLFRQLRSYNKAEK